MTHAAEVQAAPATDEDTNSIWWWVKTVVSWTVLLGLLSILAATVVVPLATGSTPYTVLTGSMTPTYPPGTLIVVKPQDADTLRGGDVITFQHESGNPAVTTHRILTVNRNADGTPSFITQGDANPVPDSNPVIPEQIRGKLWYAVPYIGYVNNVISGDKRALLIKIIAGALVVYAGYMIVSGIRERGRDKADAADDASTPEQADAAAPSATHPEGSHNVSS